MTSSRILTGDCRAWLAKIKNDSVDCCVTSPPYFGLRDYGTDGQMGLEQTPADFVQNLVEVFREVRRVLKPDGTLWLNLGDTYANARVCNRRSQIGSGSLPKGKRADRPNRLVDGLKEKDLTGIPWRVAFALQQPYYTGKIKNEADRVWLAAMLDGEGCLFVHKRGEGLHAGDGYLRTTDNYSAAFEISNTHEGIIQRCVDIAGVGSVSRQDKDRRQPIFRWAVRSNEARAIIREVYPHLVGKRQQARIICGIESSGAKAEAAWLAMKALHAGESSVMDYAPPATLFEPGWYLRQDLIWAKPNPMPESVRDRCTKAHEYLFLLSKNEKYYFDNEAIQEPAVRGYAGSEFHTGKTAEHQLGRASTKPRKAGNKTHKYVTEYEGSGWFHRQRR